jgi:hypothetical protein
MSINSILRTLAIVSFIVVLVAPSPASARPLVDRQTEPSPRSEPTTVVRDVKTDGAGQTLALVISSAALLVAAGAAARSVKLTRAA